MVDPTEVTDEDRRAAGEAYAELTGLAVQPDDLRGDWLVRRFAAHRIAAEARGAESERARVVEDGPVAWLVDDLTAAGKTCGSQTVYIEEDRAWHHADKHGRRNTKITPLYRHIERGDHLPDRHADQGEG